MLIQATSRLPSASWRISSRRSALQQGRPICSTVSAKPRLRTAVKAGVYARVWQLHESMWEDEVYTGQLPSLVLFYTDYNGDSADVEGSPEQLSYQARRALRDIELKFSKYARMNASCMVDDWYGGMHKKYGIDPREPAFLLFKEGQPMESSRRALSWFFEESFGERMRAYLIEQGLIDPNVEPTMIGDTIKDVTLDSSGRLSAFCKDSEGSWQQSYLDLNEYLANIDGEIEVAQPWSRPGNFMKSCEDVSFSDGVLIGKAHKKRWETYEPFSIDMAKLVENVGGSLSFKGDFYSKYS